ncbi:MAG: glucosaminidase domain-containing protein [Lactococcus garvieae]
MAEKKYKYMKVKERKALPKVALSAAAVLGVAAFGANAHADSATSTASDIKAVTNLDTLALNSEENMVEAGDNGQLESSETENSTDSTDPTNPTDPTDPTNPTDPTEPEKPVNPEKPKPEKPKPEKPKPEKPKPSQPKPSTPKPSTPAPTPAPAPSAPNYNYVAPVYSGANYTAQDAVTTYKQASTDGDLKFNKTNIAVPPLTKINTTTAEDFIKSIAPRISQLAGQNNLYASLIIAQAILESGYGHSNVAAIYHNLFNIIGAFNGQSVTISSGTYRAYENFDQSLVDYINLMLHGTTWNSKIYAGSWKVNSASVEDAARSLQGIFATDPEYAAKLIQIIKEYNLTQYDDIENLSEEFKNLDAPASPLLEAMPSDLKFPEYDGKQYPGASSYAWGNCTQYVYNRIFQLGGKIGQFMGNGGVWGSSGAAQGYYTTTIPQVGYAVSFPPGVAGASAEYGHVAFVEKVNKDGSILVSEMNVKGLNVVNYRTISASDASLSTYIQPQK